MQAFLFHEVIFDGCSFSQYSIYGVHDRGEKEKVCCKARCIRPHCACCFDRLRLWRVQLWEKLSCAVGYDEGYEKGYTAGHEDGYKKGKKADYNNGYEASYNDGYDAGYDDGLAGVERGKKNQFDLTDDEIDAATKAARDKTEENYAEYADIIADGYKAD